MLGSTLVESYYNDFAAMFCCASGLILSTLLNDVCILLFQPEAIVLAEHDVGAFVNDLSGC